MTDNVLFDNIIFMVKIDSIVLLYITYLYFEENINDGIYAVYCKLKHTREYKDFFLSSLYTLMDKCSKENNIPIDNIPIDNIPIDNIPIDNIPIDNIPIDNIPIDNIKKAKVELSAIERFNRRALYKLRKQYTNVMIELDIIVNKRKHIHNNLYTCVMKELLSNHRGLFGTFYFSSFVPELKKTISVVKNEPIIIDEHIINESISPVASENSLVIAFFGHNPVMMRSGTPTCEKDWEVCSVVSDYTSEEIDVE
jgi:hypothetical protein